MGSGGRVVGVVDVSVVMPCLNEQDSIAWCVQRAWRGIERAGLRGEVVVCDNGSVDRSVRLAEGAGARVVHEARRGYGRAYLTGIEASVGRVVVIGDSDYSYDFFELHRLIGPLFEGYDYVLGSRFAGTILPGSMPFLNRYLGNPVLTALLNSLFGLDTSDAHSGMRAFTRGAFERMGLRCEGMEFASEIVIAAARERLRVTEVPITYHPRLGHSKLRRWRDGVRHVRFMLAEALWPRTPGATAATAAHGRRSEHASSPAGTGAAHPSANGSRRPTNQAETSGALAARPSTGCDPADPQAEPATKTTET
jgi:glycosyltransferase involved in cell wall biosynthesis